MDRIKITGGNPLNGTIPISGAKNAALPLLIASLLTDEGLTLKNVPNLADVNMLMRILRNHGVDIAVDGKRPGNAHLGETVHLNARTIVDTTAPYEMVSRMRASFWVLGPLIARMGKAKVSLPGGCAIGTRPVDMHLTGLKEVGADLDIEGGYVIASAPKGLKGAHIVFPKVSVGATHQVLLAAALARGETVIENAACEPEIGDVADCLVKMGVKIDGIGTSVLRIQGRDRLEGAKHTVLPDRIEAGTFAYAVGATSGDVTLEGISPRLLQSGLDALVEAGSTVTDTGTGIRIQRNANDPIQPVSVETQPFPGFPTDLQAQLMALLTRADGTSHIRETIFENRFMHVQELARLGADIHLQGDCATINGVKALTGAPVMATDLRASVSLVIAALMASGETMINRVYHLDRGFEQLEKKLSRCGAIIERVSEG